MALVRFHLACHLSTFDNCTLKSGLLELLGPTQLGVNGLRVACRILMPKLRDSNPQAGQYLFQLKEILCIFSLSKKPVVPPASAVHYKLGSVLLDVVLR
jgi:hypothetical protein